MIAPDMATMLAFIFTDAPIAAAALRALLSESVVDTLNAITVDGDTSTSDTLLLFATGAAAARGAPKISSAGDRRLGAFRKALQAVLADLAEQLARDGEGARKLVRINVKGAVSKKSARRIALSIANSPLVKTAIAGEDANWGRVVMAVGKAGEPAKRDRLAIWFGDIRAGRRARSGLPRGAGFRLYEARRDRSDRRSQARPRRRPGADLRSHQGIHRDQRRLSELDRMHSRQNVGLRVGLALTIDGYAFFRVRA
jgi:N-acetylglutamate synthase/N-acetylornithine aminotransferase